VIKSDFSWTPESGRKIVMKKASWPYAPTTYIQVDRKEKGQGQPRLDNQKKFRKSGRLMAGREALGTFTCRRKGSNEITVKEELSGEVEREVQKWEKGTGSKNLFKFEQRDLRG